MNWSSRLEVRGTPLKHWKSLLIGRCEHRQAAGPFPSGRGTVQAGFPGRIRPRLEEKRLKAESEAENGCGAKISLKKRDNAPETYRPPPSPKAARAEASSFYIHKKRNARSPSPKTTTRTSFGFCESMSLVMERSPTVFEKAEEEHIRVHYLVQLNGQYQGKATGETFNNHARPTSSSGMRTRTSS